MSVRVRWHEENHQLLIVQFSSHWTWNEFFRAKATMDNMLDDESDPVNCLFFAPTDIILPPDSLRNGKHAFVTIHPNLNHMIVVKPNILLRTVYDMVLKRHPDLPELITLADTQDHAMQLLAAPSIRDR